MKSDVLDIIFENRNKAYGAYSLRKFYNNRLLKSLGLMLAGIILLSAFTLIPDKKNNKDEEKIETVMAQVLPEIKPHEKEPEKPKEQPQPVKTNVATVQSTTNIKIVPSNTDVKPIDAITDSVALGNVTSAGKPGDVAVVGTPGDGGGNEPGKGNDPVVEPVVDINVPLTTPDVMPEFPGGVNALRRFLQKNLTNPRDMEENELVSVKVRFVVGYDGKLKSFETVEDGGEEFNKEVVRVLKKMPEWIPGKTKGQNVSVYYTIPVKFVPAN